MGRIVAISCACCGAHFRVKTGCGVLHGDLTEVLKAFSKEQKEEIAECLKGEPFPVYDFAFRIGFCTRCADFVSVPALKLPEYGKAYIGACEKCNNQVELTENVQKMLCPVCGGSVLHTEEIGFWD